jgi:hypothetical protein
MRLAALFSLLGLGGAAAAQNARAEQDRAALKQFPEVNRAVKDVSPIIDKAARNHAESSASKATGGSAVVTSRDRSGPLASPAHNRGAIDVVTPNNRADAAKISKEAGSQYTTIHEKPVRPAPGSAQKPHDVHTVYSGGKQVSVSNRPPRATGEHVHVQPEFNKRLHEAANTPKPKTEAGLGRNR